MIHIAARAGDLTALQDAIKRGDDVNNTRLSADRVSWFVGMYIELKYVFASCHAD